MRSYKNELNIGEAFLEGIKLKKLDDQKANASRQPAPEAVRPLEGEAGSPSFEIDALKDPMEDASTPLEYPERAQNNRLYKLNFWIASSNLFNAFITILIIMNTVCLALDRYPMPESELAVLGNSYRTTM